MNRSGPRLSIIPVTPAPLVDYTTLNAIESLFVGRTRDPAAVQLAGQFADVFAYSDAVRYPNPLRRQSARPQHSLIRSLSLKAKGTLEPLPFFTDQSLTLPPAALLATFDAYFEWCEKQKPFLQEWIKAQREPWVKALRGTASGTVFDHADLHRAVGVREKAQSLGLTERGLLYGFDVALRYHLYGNNYGSGQVYLSHPVRTGPKLPTARHRPAKVEPRQLSFAASVAEIAESLDRDGYASLLKKLRWWVRRYKLREADRDDVGRDLIRDLAADVGFQPKLKKSENVAPIAGILAVASDVIPLPPVATGAAVWAALSAVWKGNLPRSAAKARWLRPLLVWEIESEDR